MALGQHRLVLKRKSGGFWSKESSAYLDPKNDRQMHQELLQLVPDGADPEDYRIDAYRGRDKVRSFP